MEYQVGEKVIHRTFGAGEIVQLDVKVTSGNAASYYIIQVGDMTIWVPKGETPPENFRRPTPGIEFDGILDILRSPAEPLSKVPYERKTFLHHKIRDGTLQSICHVVRDLSYFHQSNKMNESDGYILEHAKKFLLNEWQLSLSLPVGQAGRELQQLLEENQQNQAKPQK